MDRLNIRNLEIFAFHGVFEHEKRNGQLFVVSASLYTDLRAAGKSDDLAKTLDYGRICHAINAYMKGNQFNLIETVAERLAEMLLVEYPTVKKVWVEVKKPNAPIELDFEAVSVDIERRWYRVYIGLGSNLGDRAAHLNFAVRELRKVRGCRVLKASSFINSMPYGNVEQGDFLNACLSLDTLLSAYELLDCLLEIENKAGRIRDVRWGPRTLDLDILMYEGLVMKTDRLTLPHAEMHMRDFVLRPLCEIEPDLVHPVYNKTMTELLKELSNH